MRPARGSNAARNQLLKNQEKTKNDFFSIFWEKHDFSVTFYYFEALLDQKLTMDIKIRGLVWPEEP